MLDIMHGNKIMTLGLGLQESWKITGQTLENGQATPSAAISC